MKKLPLDRIPTTEEILSVDYFNRLTYKDMGRFIYRGTDDKGNKVFSIGRGTSRVIIPCLKNFVTLLHEESGLNEKVILSNMSPVVPFTMTMGGFFSRGLKIDFIGVPLLVAGAKEAYGKVIELVTHTREMAERTKDYILVLDNKQV